MSDLYLPRRYRNAQMSTPIVFWFSKKLDHIMLPPSHIPPAPKGYEKIECKNAAEVDKWSARLRAQEKRLAEMKDEERYTFEDRIRSHMLLELKENLKKATDENNRIFLEMAIRNIEAKRKIRTEQMLEAKYTERAMHCEKEEGVAS